MHRTGLSWAAASLAAALSTAPAAAQTGPDTLYLRSLAATCANCHGTDGAAAPGGPMYRLAGLKAEFITEQLQAFRDGKRPATVMHQLAKGYSDEQIAALAAYFAAQAK
ncbi:c-type cytochrome [Caldimonas sp. KR1-144]|uniref:c-type cytochrome n=1 Tax=Caldimonas sp. KR1-144 TaxID=3400911 RepID=UPI003C0C6246